MRTRRGVLLALSLVVVLAGGVASADTQAPADPAGPQPASLVYDEAAGARAYAAPGGLVVAGRDNYDDPAFRDVAAKGGTVLFYLDPIIDNAYGRYHEMLLERSACGPAASTWPGSPRANAWGRLLDFRPGSVVQQKLKCVLETMVEENPHMAGWFADDVGSRSWFPLIDWRSWPAWQQQAYRDGAIELTRTFREVADEHGLIVIVNGTWGAGSVDRNGGGYPDPEQAGNALADGGFVENHDGRSSYFGPYSCSSQWAEQSEVTKGRSVNYAIVRTTEGLAEYRRNGCFSYVNLQRSYDYAAPWSAFYDRDLPSGSRR